MEFHETFPTWDNKFSGDNLNERTKLLLKSLPSGHNGYSSSFAAAPYSNSPLENESNYCFNISSGLGQILATTKDVELRKFIWEVTHCFLLIISIISRMRCGYHVGKKSSYFFRNGETMLEEKRSLFIKDM